jgi:thiopurine S-methyltransferase
MDHEFWRSRWRQKDIGFHQRDVLDLLQKHWAALGTPKAADVLVPLCGKSLDMVWIAEQGHRVIGVELSEIAVDEFFAERGLSPSKERSGNFAVKRAGPYELWCGDIFEMPREALAATAGVYDRAALVAFPPGMQPRYATALCEKLPAKTAMLLVTFDYDQTKMEGPPFAVSREQVDRLFGGSFAISEAAARRGVPKNPRFVERGLETIEECAFVLKRGG